MNFDEQKSVWTRICPSCQKLVEHKNKAKCRGAENHNKICLACSQALNGERRRMQDTCPICQGSFACIKELDSHAASHNMTGEELWAKKINVQIPTCKCGCGGKTTFNGWHNGWNEFTFGCGGKIHTFLSEERCKEIAKIRYDASANWRNHWKGKTKETDPKLAEMSKKTAATRKAKIASGEITVWSKGKTKKTDQRLADYSERQKERFASGELVPWAKGQTKETDERIAKMSLKVSMTLKCKAIRERLDQLKRLSPEEISERVKQSGRLEVVRMVGEYINDKIENIVVKCKICGQERQDNLRSLQYGRCYNCDPAGSADQQSISAFILSLNEKVETNCRKIISPQEIDIYVDNKKFAIEYNGLFWHSELKKSNVYHENKTLDCKAKGIQLMHVFEDEWHDKSEIIKSLIRHRLGKDKRKIGARKCTIAELTKEQRYDFFEENHIDGDVVISKTAWGLLYNDELVAALSVRKPFHKSNSNLLEIARFCTIKNTSVIGGLAKLTKVALSHAKNEGYTGLFTYVDTRIGTGKGYEKCGFKQTRTTPPRFWWYHAASKSRFNRFKYRASKKDGLTEKEIAAEAGVIKIWGCSNLVYELIP